MRQYEVIYIIKPELDEEKTTSVIERFATLITNAGGEITKTEQWGKKRLAYEVNDYREGYYVLLNFTGEPTVAHELERVFKITDEIIRFIVVRMEE